MAWRLAGLALALLGALGLAWGDAWATGGAGWLAAWEQRHPDPRDLGPAGRQRFGDDRRARALADVERLALAALVGGLSLVIGAGRSACARRRWTVACGAGAVAVGLVSGGRAVAEVVDLAGRERWTLGDDGLPAFAGPLTPTLRSWRDAIPEDHAVLLLGTQDFLLNRVGWALHPRPVHPVVLPAPPGLDPAQLAAAAVDVELGADAPGRWLVDLAALEQGRDALAPIPPREGP